MQSRQADFGTRFLTDLDKVYDHNSWDAVQPSADEISSALSLIEVQKTTKLADEIAEQLDRDAASQWDTFYSNNTTNFFKDRRWLQREFSELFQDNSLTICEIGCAVGNTLFPVLKETSNNFIYGLDYSSVAIEFVKKNSSYDESRCKVMVYDITSEIPCDIPPNSVDVVTCIFVLSAIHPKTWAQASKNIYNLLKPGGILLFRDYGRHDLAQLRFKSNRYIQENFYCRGDGTRVYFFTNEEMETLFGDFNVLSNEMDRRLLTNRQRQLKMHRAWVQAKFQKPL